MNVLVLPARGPQRADDPVFYFDGGPGAGAAGAAPRVARLLSAVNAARDLVFVDVRGTGGSGAIDCAEPAASDPLQRHFDEFLSDDYVRECLRRQSADVRFYTQPLAMDDIDDVREALGYHTINLFGSSGGTRQEQIYMRRHPANVRTAVLHGVDPMDGEMPLSFSRAMEAGLRGLFMACAADPGCSAEFPALAADWERSKRYFADGHAIEADLRNPASGRIERVRITRGVYADGIRHMLYDFNLERGVPAVIHAAGAGDFTRFAERELAQSSAYAALLAHGMFMSSTCAEDVQFISEDDVRIATEGTFLGDYRVRRQQAACRIWPKGEGVDADFQRAITTAVPVLIISGELDVATPPADAERVARALPNARHIIFPRQGHTFVNPACAARLIGEFIEVASSERLSVGCVGGN